MKRLSLSAGSGPLTGDAAQYGVGVKNAIQLAVDEVNAAGGVNGNKLKLRYLKTMRLTRAIRQLMLTTH